MIHLTLFLILLDLCILDTVNHWHNTQFSSNFKDSSFPVLRDFIKIYTYQLKSLENVKSFKYHQGFPQSLAFSLFTGKSRVPVMEKSHFKLCEGWLVTHTSIRLSGGASAVWRTQLCRSWGKPWELFPEIKSPLPFLQICRGCRI